MPSHHQELAFYLEYNQHDNVTYSLTRQTSNQVCVIRSTFQPPRFQDPRAVFQRFVAATDVLSPRCRRVTRTFVLHPPSHPCLNPKFNLHPRTTPWTCLIVFFTATFSLNTIARPHPGANIVVKVLPVPQAPGCLDARPHRTGGSHQGLGYGRNAKSILVAMHDLPQR